MSLREVLPVYTVADYLKWEGDWELWEGHPVAMAPSPTPYHQKSGSNLVFHLMTQLRAAPCSSKCRVLYELDWHVNETTVVRPDIMIYCHEISKEKWIEKPPAFIGEILSPSTRSHDLVAKKSLYAENGVKYYLIADPDSEELSLFLLTDGAYEEIDASSQIELNDVCSVQLDPQSVFE